MCCIIYIHIHLLSKCNDNWSVRCELLAISLAAGTWQTLNLHINADPHRITVCTDGMLLLSLKCKGSQLNNAKTYAFKESIRQTANNDLLLLFLSQLFVCCFFTMPRIQRLTLCTPILLFRGTYNPSCFPPSLQYQMGDCGVSH